MEGVRGKKSFMTTYEVKPYADEEIQRWESMR